jgi:hypothetical protein
MFFNLNESFSLPPRWLPIEIHSGKLPVPLTLVRPCLLRMGERLGHRLLTVRLSTPQILQVPSNIIATIAATSMYRLLLKFGSSETEM